MVKSIFILLLLLFLGVFPVPIALVIQALIRLRHEPLDRQTRSNHLLGEDVIPDIFPDCTDNSYLLPHLLKY